MYVLHHVMQIYEGYLQILRIFKKYQIGLKRNTCWDERMLTMFCFCEIFRIIRWERMQYFMRVFCFLSKHIPVRLISQFRTQNRRQSSRGEWRREEVRDSWATTKEYSAYISSSPTLLLSSHSSGHSRLAQVNTLPASPLLWPLFCLKSRWIHTQCFQCQSRLNLSFLNLCFFWGKRRLQTHLL